MATLGLGTGLGRVCSARAFQPKSLSGLAGWYDASDAATITQSSGLVSQWNDKSGAGNHLTQSNSSYRFTTGSHTINGKNVLFAATQQSSFNVPSGLYSLFNSDWTMFFVKKNTVFSPDQWYMSGFSGGYYGLFIPSGGGSVRALSKNGAFTNVSSVSVTNNTYQQSIGAFKESGYITAFADGVLGTPQAADNKTLTGSNVLALGAFGSTGGTGISGDIAEVVIYNRSLTVAERAKVDAYLARKWGMAQKIVTFGDSITAGASASTETNRWANIVANTLGVPLVNKGLVGSILQNTSGASVATGISRYAADLLGAGKCDKAYILYGVNDVYQLGSYPSMTVVQFTADMNTIVSALKAGGYSAGNIIIGSPPYFTANGNPTLQSNYRDACRAVAVTQGVKYADVYQAMINYGWSSQNSGDNLHPNNTGHTVIASAMLAADFVS